MKVFISWSGERSLAVARALYQWLPRIVQAIQPWMSESYIDKGSRWEQIISQELADTRFGIVCLTPENLDSRWINFEAGAISKAVERSQVCTYLVDLRPADIEGPLAQFNHTSADRDDTRRLVHTLNRILTSQALGENIVDDTFDMFWPKLEMRLLDLPRVKTAAEPSRSVDDMVGEILQLVRAQTGRESRSLERTSRPRVLSTLDWSPEDAWLITDYYQSVKQTAINTGRINDPTISEFLDRIRNDRGFATRFLDLLKQLPPDKLEHLRTATLESL